MEYGNLFEHRARRIIREEISSDENERHSIAEGPGGFLWRRRVNIKLVSYDY